MVATAGSGESALDLARLIIIGSRQAADLGADKLVTAPDGATALGLYWLPKGTSTFFSKQY